MDMRLVFMGTPEFSVHTLEVLAEVGNEICAVFTQPDKPKNRGKRITTSPVKDFAVSRGFPVYQPRSLRGGEDAEEALRILREIAPDAIVVVAYGQILPREILELPRYGCINAHASLLPKYRGAAPIQRCIQNGDTETSLCTMRMDEGLDTGDVIMRRDVVITPEMTGTELSAILSHISGELVAESLVRIANGTANYSLQTYCRTPSYAERITKEELDLDFTQPAKRVYDFIRAMADAPCAYTFLEGKRLKVYRSRLTERESALPAGSIADAETFAVACGDGFCVELTEVQPEGGKRMTADAFLRGKRLTEGAVLGVK